MYLSQLIRVSRICTKYDAFYQFYDKLTSTFLDKGFTKLLLTKYFSKFVDDYELEWSKFAVVPELPKSLT